jgi:hypothetical protein
MFMETRPHDTMALHENLHATITLTIKKIHHFLMFCLRSIRLQHCLYIALVSKHLVACKYLLNSSLFHFPWGARKELLGVLLMIILQQNNSHGKHTAHAHASFTSRVIYYRWVHLVSFVWLGSDLRGL